MAAPRAYLDYNASAPLLPEAEAAAIDALRMLGNASSVHAEGRAKRAVIEKARRNVARLCDGSADRVVFTSGATEAASTLLTPSYRMGRAPLVMSHLYVLATEHPCVLSGGQFDESQITRIAVDRNGIADLDELSTHVKAHDKEVGLPLVACHLANNENGAIQPIGEISRVVKDSGGVLIVDAVQAAGRIEIDIETFGADFLFLSSHKIGGPQGAGAIVSASDVLMPAPLLHGGGQEKGHRSGTENTPSIAGFGVAAELALEDLSKIGDVCDLRDRFEVAIRERIPGAEILCTDAPRLPNTSFFVIPGLKAETAQIAFDLAGVALSAGSACSSGKVGDSHVLEAMGLGDIGSALRLSIGHATGEAELGAFERALDEIAKRLETNSKAA